MKQILVDVNNLNNIFELDVGGELLREYKDTLIFDSFDKIIQVEIFKY